MNDSVPQKLCKRCQQVKPVEDFSKNKSATEGLQYWCRECNRHNWKSYSKDPRRGKIGTGHKAAIAAPDQTKECTVCHRVLPLDDFYPVTGRKGKYGRRSNCKECST